MTYMSKDTKQGHKCDILLSDKGEGIMGWKTPSEKKQRYY